MKVFTEEDWSRLAKKYPASLVAVLKGICVRGESSVLTAHEVGNLADVPSETAEEVLDILADHGFFLREEREVCPSCGGRVPMENGAPVQCSVCGFSFEHDSPRRQRVFTRSGRRSRDTRWVVTVHGMNTRGAWEEAFAWKLTLGYGYSIPVFIHKYGRLLVSPLLLLRQSVYRDRLNAALRERIREMASTVYGPRPDVIAHSFGTWLVAQALSNDPELRIGRLVLTGSIVRPDFDWASLVESGRVEAVLCHCGGRDRWVRFAQYFIPNSGPSGFSGFNDRASVLHTVDPTFAHSDFFLDEHLSSALEQTWAPFLTSPAPAASGAPRGLTATVGWRPSPLRMLSHVLKYAVLAGILLLLTAVLYIFALGLDRVTGGR